VSGDGLAALGVVGLTRGEDVAHVTQCPLLDGGDWAVQRPPEVSELVVDAGWDHGMHGAPYPQLTPDVRVEVIGSLSAQLCVHF
jgi:hypothetical protein